MPEKNPQICGKTFQADYLKDGNQWKCQLTATDKSLLIDGYGVTDLAAFQDAQAQVEARLHPKKK